MQQQYRNCNSSIPNSFCCFADFFSQVALKQDWILPAVAVLLRKEVIFMI
jgi:hypothetical protein